jgi:hypothetical protein
MVAGSTRAAAGDGTAPRCGGVVFVANPTFKETVNVVKVGLNLKWGPGFLPFGY